MVLFSVDPCVFVNESGLESLQLLLGLFEQVYMRICYFSVHENQEANDLVSLGADVFVRLVCHLGELLKEPGFFLRVLSDFLGYELLGEDVEEIKERLELHLSFVALERLRIIQENSEGRQLVDPELSESLLLLVIELSEDHLAFEGFREGLNVDGHSFSLGKEENLRKLSFCFHEGQVRLVGLYLGVVLDVLESLLHRVDCLQVELLLRVGEWRVEDQFGKSSLDLTLAEGLVLFAVDVGQSDNSLEFVSHVLELLGELVGLAIIGLVEVHQINAVLLGSLDHDGLEVGLVESLHGGVHHVVDVSPLKTHLEEKGESDSQNHL